MTTRLGININKNEACISHEGRKSEEGGFERVLWKSGSMDLCKFTWSRADHRKDAEGICL